jgi:hypothetical protein
LNFIAIGASYRRLASSKVKQQTSASILNVNKSEEDVNQSFQSLANAVSGFLRRLDVPYVVEKKRPEDLTNFEAAGIVFRSNESCLANVSAIGSYISERLNVGLDLKDDGLRFAPLCHANIYLDGLLNK